MNLIRVLVEAFNPCIHQWEKIEVLKDDPDNPRVVCIVSQCIVCGTIKQDEFTTPSVPGKKCPPHKWITTHETKIVSDVAASAAGEPHSTLGYVFTQKCEHCGDIRRVDTRDEGRQK